MRRGPLTKQSGIAWFNILAAHQLKITAIQHTPDLSNNPSFSSGHPRPDCKVLGIQPISVLLFYLPQHLLQEHAIEIQVLPLTGSKSQEDFSLRLIL